MSRYTQLRDGLVNSMQDHLAILLKGHWDKITSVGRAALIEVSELLVECKLQRAAGRDPKIAETALAATIGNWETVAWLTGASLTLETLKSVLAKAVGLVFTALGAL